MKLAVRFIGADTNEQTPTLALYEVNASGQVTKKIAVERSGEIEVSTALTNQKNAVVALGPDTDDVSGLDANSLVQLRVSDQLAGWQQNKAIVIPPLWWRGWISLNVCVSGKVSKCWPWIFDPEAIKAHAINPSIPYFPEICFPLCNAVVEVWESTCCCWPFIPYEVPPLISKLASLIERNPISFPPVPNPPDPVPYNGAALEKVQLALAQGNIPRLFAPNTDLARHLENLRSLSAEQAVNYVELNPSLWPIWCRCTSTMLGETVVNPDGTFSFCWVQFPFILFNCRRSYFYKVKQWNGTSWVYIYDGSEAYQYFNADQFANLTTPQGQLCGQSVPPPGTDFAMLQLIGGTSSYLLHSNWNGASTAGVDLTQASEFSMTAPPSNGGLVDFGPYLGAPWAQTLNFLLYFHPGLEALGVVYYRLSIVPADLSGAPAGGKALAPIMNSVAWSEWVLDGSGHWTTQAQVLGPVSKGAQNGLFKIPYADDALWLGGQYHQSLDTTLLANGRYLLAMEVFDKNGNRLIPAGAPADPGDVPTNFEFLRWLTATGANATATVPFAALTHLFWIDNRPVIGSLEDLDVNGQASAQECQFLSGPGNSTFQVGSRAYHLVMGDPSPDPIPPATFMQNYALSWTEGLGGPSGILCTGAFPFPCTAGDANQPATMGAGPNVKTVAVTFSSLLGLPPAPQACAFTVNLAVTCKHTDGSSHIYAYDVYREASFAIAIT